MTTYKIGILKAFSNGCFKSNIVEFEAGNEQFKKAALYLVEQNKEYQDCFLFDPETLCPITFDFTYHLKSVVHEGSFIPYDCFSLTYADMIKRLDKVTSEKTIRPFTRTIYSKSGKLGEFLNMHGGLNINMNMEGKEDSMFFGPHFDEIEITRNKNKAA